MAVVDGEFLRAPRSPGQGGSRLVLAQNPWPASLRSRSEYPGSLSYTVTTLNTTVASQSERIHCKASADETFNREISDYMKVSSYD